MALIPSQTRDSILALQMPVSNNLGVLKKGDQAFSSFIGDLTNTGFLAQNSGVLGKGTLSVAAPIGGGGATLQTLVLSSSDEVAQFRAGEQVFLVGNNYVGATGGTPDLADGPLTVIQTSPVNQTVTVQGRAAATSTYSIGASLVRVNFASAVGGDVGGVLTDTAQGAGWFDNSAYARVLQGIITAIVDRDGFAHAVNTGTNVNVEIISNTLFADLAIYGQTLVGGTLTFATGGGSALNDGYTATVATAVAGGGVAPNRRVELTLTDIVDATGTAQATMAAVTTNNTVVFQHNWVMVDAALAELVESGGDQTRMVAAAAQLHRRLKPGALNNTFEMTLDEAYKVEPVKKGVRLRLAAQVTTTGAAQTIVVAQDEAAGDIPVPLSGTLAVVDYGTGVNSIGSNMNDGTTTRLARRPATGYAAYTRAKGSNVLTVTLAGGAVTYFPGVMVEFSAASTGVVTNQGWAPTVNPAQQFSWLMTQILDAVNSYDQLGT